MSLSRRQCLVGSAGTLTWRATSAQLAGKAAADDRAGYELVLQRLRSEYLAQGSAADAARLLNSLPANGLWPDVDYADRSQGDWRAMPHLNRLRTIALASQQPGRALHDSPAARQALNSGLRAWLTRKPTSTNWWHNTIGQQLLLMQILVLARPLLANDVATDATALLHDPAMVPPEQTTGQNLVWYATQQLVRGALTGDATDLARASAALQSTLRITREEGIQADFSFHQHGAQLYSGGYGLGFLQDSARTAHWLAGTPWAFTADRLTLLADYALNGIVPLIRGNWLDWGARGREFTRDEQVPRPRLVLAALRQLEPLVPDRTAALAAAVAQLADVGGQASIGNRYYWRSDFMVHQTSRGFISLKMTSSRTVGTESGNGENLLGYWLPFGVTYILKRGDEYDDLPPVWDWTALPGLTAPAAVPAFTGYQRHGEAFVGGVSDGTAGLAAMVLNKLQTQARRAWFFNGDLMLALGSGIQSDHGRAVNTTLNQTRWTGKAITDRGPVDLTGDGVSLDGRAWVWIDGVTYLLMDAPQSILRLDKRRQDSSRINPALGRKGVEATVCTLSIEHGVRPKDAHYGYGVWLGAGRAELASQAPIATVLSNTVALQAVRYAAGGLLQAVIHSAGTLALDDRYQLSVDAPCLIQARGVAGNWVVDVLEPTRLLTKLKLKIWRDGQQFMATDLALSNDASQPGQVRWIAKR